MGIFKSTNFPKLSLDVDWIAHHIYKEVKEQRVLRCSFRYFTHET